MFIEDSQPLHSDYPLPDLDDPIMRPFWEGARQGKLMQQREPATGWRPQYDSSHRSRRAPKHRPHQPLAAHQRAYGHCWRGQR